MLATYRKERTAGTIEAEVSAPVAAATGIETSMGYDRDIGPVKPKWGRITRAMAREEEAKEKERHKHERSMTDVNATARIRPKPDATEPLEVPPKKKPNKAKAASPFGPTTKRQRDRVSYSFYAATLAEIVHRRATPVGAPGHRERRTGPV